MSEKNNNIVAHFVSMRRVARVNSGGKTFRSSVLVVVGDEKGRVGYGLGKSSEVPESVKKATRSGTKRMIKVSLFEGRTLYYDVKAKFCQSLVYIRKARAGTGIVAGGAARYVFEALGVKDVVCKVLGNNPINNVRAIMKALSSIKTPKEIARRRSVPKENLFYNTKKKELGEQI
ncbi:30S ribosomal protein S5 [Alphaproteobacteria bacterium endosymbiont of Tiliacea citrago]|uniref:30S ribosomal protein S5 n=1 Tax=Alphaproteobacteria bacterium endosymbiont of Tiliacea citrago TaxID=3077944 RepID=UPI00313A9C05